MTSSAGRRPGSVPIRHRSILAVAGFAVVLRVVVGFLVRRAAGPTLDPDSRDYLAIAHHLGELGSAHGQLLEISLLHPPGYPAFVWLASLVGGTACVLVAQALVGGVSVVLVHQIALHFLPPRAAVLAALMLAVEPLSIFYTGLVLSETLYTALLLGVLLVVLTAWEHGSWTWAFGAGALLGCSILVRPVGLYLTVVLVVLTVIVLRRRLAATVVVALVVGMALLVSPWVLRNAHLAGGPVVTTVDSYNILFYRAAGALADEQGETPAEVGSQLQAQLGPRIAKGGSLAGQASVERSEGLNILLHHPRGTVISTAKGGLHVLLAPGRDNYAKTFPSASGAALLTVSVLTLAATALLLAAAVLGALRLARRQRPGVLLVVCTFLYLALVTFGAEGESRFRVPMVPLLAILAAGGVWQLRSISARLRG